MFINAFLKKKDVKMRGKKEEKPSMKRNGIETSCVIIIVFIRPNFLQIEVIVENLKLLVVVLLRI